jgi:hypothetical protein
MRKIILTSLAAALMAASTAPMAVAAERHHVRKMDRAPVSDQFRNANNALVQPAQLGSYSGFDGHALSAPAGR